MLSLYFIVINLSSLITCCFFSCGKYLSFDISTNFSLDLNFGLLPFLPSISFSIKSPVISAVFCIAIFEAV